MEAENRETVLREYTKQLSSADLLEIGDKLVVLNNEEEKVDIERKLAAASFNEKLKRIKADMKRLLQIYEKQEEVIEEECTVEYYWEDGIVLYVSCESGLHVDQRIITQEERQLKLFKEEKSKDHDEKMTDYDDNDETMTCSPPRCHMKDMEFVEDPEGNDQPFYRCSTCGAIKKLNTNTEEENNE